MSLWRRLFTGSKRKQTFDLELSDRLYNRTQQELEQLTPLNIMVVGKTGSGKSTLINALFREEIAKTGIGLPVTATLQRLHKEGVPLTLYDTQGLELNAQTKATVQDELLTTLKQQKNKGIREEIHLIYYCLSAQLGRIEQSEIELIEQLSQHAPVIIVLTQAIGTQASDFQQLLVEMQLPVQAVIKVMAKPLLVEGEQYLPAFGLEELLRASLQVVPKEVQRAFINAQRVDLELKVKSARRWAKTYVSTAFGIGFTPIPVADAAVLVPMQITMLAHLTTIFGLSLDKSQIISVIAGIGGTGGATMLGKYVAGSLTKLIPGLGTVGGGVISGSTASALTVALAYSYIEVLRQITLAEHEGRDLALREIQRLMNANFKDQLAYVQDRLPESVKESDWLQWVEDYLDQTD